MEEHLKVQKLLEFFRAKKFFLAFLLFPALFSSAFVFGLYYFFLAPPADFPSNSTVAIARGLSLAEAAAELEQERIIKSKAAFVFLARLLGEEKKLKSGDYFFSKPLKATDVLRRLSNGDYGLVPVKITIPEGFDAEDIANIFKGFKNFDRRKFLEKVSSQKLEGYLFPDTYYFLPNMDEDEIIKIMRENFEKKVGKIDYDVLIMASLVEKEVNSSEDRRVVAGILWKRLNAGMPLQVDAVFPYIFKGDKKRILFEDLEIDSPYNTYKYKGLPPTPICNPGLDAINAARHPKDSPYWYYLSGKDGKTHFARTFDEHKLNKERYLWYK